MPAAGTAQTSLRWLIARAGSPVATSTVSRALRDGGDRLHGRPDPQRLAGGHPALDPAGPGGAPVQPAVGTPLDLVVGLRATTRRAVEPVAQRHALDRLDAHQRTGQPGVQPPVPVDVAAQPRRQSVGEDLDDTAEGVTVLLRRVDLGHHGGARGRVEAADRVGVQPLDVVRFGPDAVRGGRTADGDDVGDQPGTDGLGEERLGHRAQRDPGRRLPGARALQHRTGVVEPVLLHAGEVRVPRSRSGQRGVAGEAGQGLGRHRVGAHDLLPLRPLGVADPDGDRAALGEPVPHAAEQLDVVALEGHPRAAAVAEPTPRERVGEVVGRDRDPGGQPFEGGEQGRAVRLPRGQPAQHAPNPRRRGRTHRWPARSPGRPPVVRPRIRRW